MILIKTYRLAILPKRPMFENGDYTYILRTRMLKLPRLDT